MARTGLRLLLLCLLPLVLAGCGYQPLYGQNRSGQAVRSHLAAVAVDPIEDRVGQLLRNALEDRINRAGGVTAQKHYGLSIELSESSTGIAIQKDATASRSNLQLTATFVLRGNGQTLWSERSQATVAYNILDNQYATIMAERDARERAVVRLADDIAERVGVFLSRQGGSGYRP